MPTPTRTDANGRAGTTVCYFVSEYPAVSHTFVRREIVELERHDIEVFRVSLRRNALPLVDPADLAERARTAYLFDATVRAGIRAAANALVRRPAGLARAVAAALKLMRRSSRARVFHLAYLAEAVVLADWCLARRVHHIHAHFGTNGAEVALLAHLLSGIPYSFTVHGPDEFDRPEYLGLAAKAEHAAFVCAVSSFTRSQLCRWIAPQAWPKVAVVRCGLDADFRAPPPRTRIARENLVTVGRLSGQKGQLVLLHALARLAREGVPFKMTIAGDGPLRPQLERHICDLGLAGRVTITGWLTNQQVRARILESRALVLPSFAEGLPVVLMEALALARPVVATYVAGIPELVTDGVCGWLVPAGSVERLAAAMKECLAAPDALVEAMGRAGRARVLQQHDIARECRRLAGLFRSRPGRTRGAEPAAEVARHAGAGNRAAMPAGGPAVLATARAARRDDAAGGTPASPAVGGVVR